MSPTNMLLLGLFWGTQIVAAIVLKYSSMVNGSRSMTLFVAGNAINITSVWFVTQMYRTMNANVAFGVAIGGAFLCIQLALALVFRSALAPAQYAGLAAICCGVFLVALGGRG